MIGEVGEFVGVCFEVVKFLEAVGVADVSVLFIAYGV